MSSEADIFSYTPSLFQGIFVNRRGRRGLRKGEAPHSFFLSFPLSFLREPHYFLWPQRGITLKKHKNFSGLPHDQEVPSSCLLRLFVAISFPPETFVHYHRFRPTHAVELSRRCHLPGRVIFPSWVRGPPGVRQSKLPMRGIAMTTLKTARRRLLGWSLNGRIFDIGTLKEYAYCCRYAER